MADKKHTATTRVNSAAKVAGVMKAEERPRDPLLSALAHDLRNPLGTAKMSAQLVLRQRDAHPAQIQLLNKIVESLERADRMIVNLLDAAMIDSGGSLPPRIGIGRFKLNEVLARTVEELALFHGDRFVLICNSACEGNWSVEDMQRVIENLASNAVKYGSPGTPVTFTLEASASFARLSVHNRGGELDPEELGSVFDLFRRARTADASGARGWGIGLTLVRGIIESYNGRVWAESGPGRGTTFFVELPLVVAAGVPGAPGAPFNQQAH